MTAIDFNCLDGPQFAGLSDAAWAMWTRGRLWCDRHQTDEIAAVALHELTRAPAKRRRVIAGELVRAGLWAEDEGIAGWRSVEPAQRRARTEKPSTAERQAEANPKASTSERARKAAEARWGRRARDEQAMPDVRASSAQASPEHQASDANEHAGACSEHDATDAQAFSPPTPPSQRSRAENNLTEQSNPTAANEEQHPREHDAAVHAQDAQASDREHAKPARIVWASPFEAEVADVLERQEGGVLIALRTEPMVKRLAGHAAPGSRIREADVLRAIREAATKERMARDVGELPRKPGVLTAFVLGCIGGIQRGSAAHGAPRKARVQGGDLDLEGIEENSRAAAAQAQRDQKAGVQF